MKKNALRIVFALLAAISLMLSASFSTAEGNTLSTTWAHDESASIPLTSEQAMTVLRLVLGMDEDNTKDTTWMLEQAKGFFLNPDQYSEDFWSGIFGTWADGISLEGDPINDGRVSFVMKLPDPVSLPETYSISYSRLDKDGKEIVITLERDKDGNIHYIDGDTELVFLRADGKYRKYAVTADGFGEWDGVQLSARSVREQTGSFWNCADQMFLKWLGTSFVEATEFLGRPCGLYHAEPGTITFSYQCDMVLDDETGICLSYTGDELIRGAVYNITEDKKVEIDIGHYDIGGEEMNFNCTRFETENVSFDVPAV